MQKINILRANNAHKEFMIRANNVINDVNDTAQTNGLKQNIDKDYFCDIPKFKYLVAEIDNKSVGMIGGVTKD